MLLPEKKEREYRFKLALRMGLPIFGLILVLVFTTLINNYENLTVSFYVESLLLLFVSVYFILYLIYKGFDAKITDTVTKTFTREYLYDYLKEKVDSDKPYTLILIGIDNLADINAQYGIKNGDKVLRFVANWIGEYVKDKVSQAFPMGRFKGGDFIIGLEGDMQKHKVLIELLCLKSEELRVDSIEIKISGAIIDTTFSKDLDHLIDDLFEQQENNRNKKETLKDIIDPTELESLVIEAIETEALSIATQKVFDRDKKEAFKELFIRIKTREGKYIHRKKYIKVINKLGLTLRFDTITLRKVFDFLSSRKNEKGVLQISTSSLRDKDFFNYVRMLLEKDATMKGRIVFMFSENEYFSNIDRFNTILHAYKNLGIASALDRLGALHTSFLYLRDLDVDIVRFDSAYTKQKKIFKSTATLKGLTTMAREKQVRTWAKMIEEEEQYAYAKKLGIDYLQGKYLDMMEENVYEVR